MSKNLVMNILLHNFGIVRWVCTQSLIERPRGDGSREMSLLQSLRAGPSVVAAHPIFTRPSLQQESQDSFISTHRSLVSVPTILRCDTLFTVQILLVGLRGYRYFAVA